MSTPSAEEIEARQSQIRKKRIATLVGCYNLLAQNWAAFREGTRLCDPLVAEVVESYLSDRAKFVSRTAITGRIQRHKIAGLMTASIAKTKPIYLVDPDAPAARTSRDNEFFAVMHGIAICSEGHPEDAIVRMRMTPRYSDWIEDLVYLVKRHPDSADGFTLIYETLCLSYFPGVLAST